MHTAGTVNSSAAVSWSLAFLYGGRVSLAYSSLQSIWCRCIRNTPKNKYGLVDYLTESLPRAAHKAMGFHIMVHGCWFTKSK